MFEAGFTRAVKVFGIVVGRAADHLPIHQGLVAITFGADQIEIGFGGSHLGASGFQLQAHVLRIEFGEWLISLHALTFIDQSSADFAANAECQIRFITGAHLARITFHRLCRRLWLHHHGWSHGDLGRLFLTAC
ncbi:hypothetical protein D3C78_1567430 [compost metagenome]